jgi:hypothetical protein
MLQPNDKPTAHQDPSDRGWAVLVSKLALWKEMAGVSVILFVLAIGVAAIGWAMLAGGDFASPLAWFQSRGKNEVTEIVAAVPAEPAARRALDGAPLDAEHSGDYAAVVIDNMTPARPSSGLAHAVLVIEAPVESSITRLLAFFDLTDEVERIGPVRSARPYFIDWATEADAMFVHVGGSPEALGRLEDEDLRDLNEFSGGAYFWRDKGRYAPHNAYTSTAEIRRAVERRHADRPLADVAAWRFADDAAHAEVGSGVLADDAPTFAIDYGAAAYDVVWTYDAATNSYLRSQGGDFVTEDGGILRAKNVVVQFAEVEILDAIGRRRIATAGPERALILKDGAVMEGTWERTDGRTRFLGSDGEEIIFNTGTTWIQVVPLGTDVTTEGYE